MIHIDVPDDRQFTFTEEQRQMMLLSIAKLALSRPGWDFALGELADLMAGREMYEAFKSHGADPPPPEPSVLEQLFAPSMFISWMIKTAHCEIHLSPRPAYCDRGNWLATISTWLPLEIDEQDRWPRYFMDLGRAKAEIEAWMRKRGAWAEGAEWKRVDNNQTNSTIESGRE